MVVVTLLAAMALHGYYRVAARRGADAAVAAVERFRQRHGRYPASMAEAGLERRRGWMPHYSCEGGRPSLLYLGTFMIFDVYFYDFDRHRWWLRHG